MTLQQLIYVSMVERCGSFSKAAQKLYVSQPSVSNLVHGLEEELHITIFQRTPSGVVVTNEGRELLKLCTLAVSLGDTETLVEQAAPHGPPHPHPCRFPLLIITAADPPAVPEGLLRLDRKRSRTMITCVIRNVCY